MKMSEEEKEEMTDWLIAREECVEEDKKEETDLTVVYLKGYADAEEKCRGKIKKLEEENRLQRSQLNSAFNNGFIPKQKIKDILNSKYRVFCEGDAEFPEFATKITTVKYIKAEVLEELLQEEDK